MDNPSSKIGSFRLRFSRPTERAEQPYVVEPIFAVSLQPLSFLHLVTELGIKSYRRGQKRVKRVRKYGSGI